MWLIPFVSAYSSCEELQVFPQLLLDMFGMVVYLATDSPKYKKYSENSHIDAIQDGFIHSHLFRFFQDTRLECTNSHNMINNRYVLQQQHVDCKKTDVFLKRH